MVIARRPTIELVSTEKHEMKLFFHKGSKPKCGPVRFLIRGLVLSILGILMTIWTPFQLFMEERLRMHRGLPPFEWWSKPPELVLMRAHVFNYTNIEEFLSGNAKNLHVEEVGPIFYKERLLHKDPHHNDNYTITYNSSHEVEYIPEMNSINLNDTIIIPNYALLSMVTYLYNAPFFVKMGFNMLANRLRTQHFMRMSIYDYLWNFTDPILTMSNTLIPSLVPVTNMGMLHRIYENFEDTITIFVGTKHGEEQFSLIDKFDGSDKLPNYKKCDDKVTNATEGVTYAQQLTKTSILKYWRKTICKVASLQFEKEMVHSSLGSYKFVLPSDSFDRVYPEYDDCYKGDPSLPSGLSDVSNCYYNVPVAASFPHFLHGDQKIKNYVTGLTPDNHKHESFVVVEPTTGVPLEAKARSQSNLVIRKLNGFNPNVTKFENMALPMFWLEYHQTGIPLKVWLLTYMVVVIVPPGQIIMIGVFFILAFVNVVRFGREILKVHNSQKIGMAETNNPGEHDEFLKPETNLFL